MSYTKSNVMRAFIYKGAEQLFVKGVSFLVGIILARLVMPDKHGILAVLNVFISFADILIQGGLTTALLQKKNVEEEDYSVVFYLSLFTSIVLYAIIFIGAPYIQDYFQMPEMARTLRVYSLTLLIGAFRAVQYAKLVKEMRLNIVVKGNVFAAVISGVVAIICAYTGLELWALVIQHLVYAVVSCVVITFMNRWYPILVFSWVRARSLWSYGWKVMASSAINTMYIEIRSLIVAKRYSAADLGYYNRGFQFPYFVSYNLNATIQTIALPVLSSEQDRIEKVKAYVKKAIVSSSYFIIPIQMFMFISARDILLLLVGEAWLPSTSYMQIFCIAYILDSLRSINGEAIKALGRSGLFLKLEIIRKILMMSLLVVSIVFFDSPLVIAISFAIGSVIECVMIAIPCKKLFSYGVVEQIKDLVPLFLISFVTVAVMYVLGRFCEITLLKLLLQGIVGVPMYILLGKMIHCDVFGDFLAMVKSRT